MSETPTDIETEHIVRFKYFVEIYCSAFYQVYKSSSKADHVYISAVKA